jgi:NAD(P)-dependent dehydrogenase (short-subunit alcohol dehydrogenase family)
MFDRQTLAGKTALIKGASSGLGRHFAEVLARAGASVTLAARREAMLEAERRALVIMRSQGAGQEGQRPDACTTQDSRSNNVARRL